MTTSPPAVEPPDGDQPHPARPELHVVRDGDPVPATEPRPAAVGDDEIAAEAPWQYRLGARVASVADQLPAVWGARPASFAERVEYALGGDWTADDPGQSAKRMAHLIGTFVCLLLDGLIVTPLRFLLEKPSRLGIFLLAALFVGYIV